MKTNKSILKSLMLLLVISVSLGTARSGQEKQIFYPGLTAKTGEFPAAIFWDSAGTDSAGIQTQEPVYEELAGPKKECRIGEDHYFTYRFVEPPKMGTAILKIELFDKNGRRVTDLDIVGISDMPSMRGAHDSGEVAFKLNKKGDYLLPVNIVMAGEWEIKLHFLKGKDVVFRGSFKFHV